MRISILQTIKGNHYPYKKRIEGTLCEERKREENHARCVRISTRGYKCRYMIREKKDMVFPQGILLPKLRKKRKQDGTKDEFTLFFYSSDADGVGQVTQKSTEKNWRQRFLSGLKSGVSTLIHV